MKVEKDYEYLLKLLNKHKVKYCIVGAFAVAFYAKPRYTKDMDIITSIPGCSFNKVWENKEIGKYGKEKVYFIGLNELIKNKRASKRKQDKVDLDILLRAKKVKE